MINPRSLLFVFPYVYYKGRGLLRRTVDAMVEQYESSKGPEGEFHAQFLGGLLRTVNSNRLRMIKIVSKQRACVHARVCTCVCVCARVCACARCSVQKG